MEDEFPLGFRMDDIGGSLVIVERKIGPVFAFAVAVVAKLLKERPDILLQRKRFGLRAKCTAERRGHGDERAEQGEVGETQSHEPR